MDNNVVIALQRSLRVAGLGTLRFNFRGVGRSTGQHRGAQGMWKACSRWLTTSSSKAPRCRVLPVTLTVPGSACAPCRTVSIRPWPSSSPPLDFLDFKGLAPPPCPCLITVGDRDEFCSLASVRSWTGPFVGAEQGVRLEILPGCDHFYAGFEKQLGEIISAFPGSIPA